MKRKYGLYATIKKYLDHKKTIISFVLFELLNFSAIYCQTKNPTAIYSGWYIGGGASYQYTESKIIVDDNIDFLMQAAGGGIISNHAVLAKTRIGKLGGSLTAGYGNFIYDNYYLGGEISLDITKNKSTKSGNVINVSSDDITVTYGTTTVKTKGFVPTVALRFGGYLSNIDCLLYARLGLTFFNNKFDNESMPNQGFKSRRITPIVGIGVEKKIFDMCSVKIEGDYRFFNSKKRSVFQKFDDDNGRIDYNNLVENYNASIKNKNSGYVVRVVCVYHF